MKPIPENITFTATLQKHPELDAAYVIFPFNVPEIFGTRGQVKVKAWFNGHEYRGSLVPMGGGHHVLGVRQDIRKAIHKTFGDEIEVELARDREPRVVILPPELEAAFEEYPLARAAFSQLSYTHQREHVAHISEAKKSETRLRRTEKTIAMLLKK